MSSTQKFSTPKEQEPQRIDHIESVLPNLVRLSEYANLKDFVNSLSEQIKDVVVRVSSLPSDIASLKEATKKTQSDLGKECSNLNAEQSTINTKISTSQGIQESHGSRIKSISDNINAFQTQVSTLERNLASLASIDSVKFLSEGLESFKKRVDSMMAESKGPANMSLSMIGDIKKELSNISVQLSAHEKKHDEIQSSIASIKLSIAESKKALEAEIVRSVGNVKSSLEAKIIPPPAPSPSITLADVKRAILEGLESVSLDAKNSILRSTNNDMKIGLLEKKLEQVMLLAKRFELNQ